MGQPPPQIHTIYALPEAGFLESILMQSGRSAYEQDRDFLLYLSALNAHQSFIAFNELTQLRRHTFPVLNAIKP